MKIDRQKRESDANCEICFEKYTEAGQKTPLVLPCGHSFCKGCCGQLPQKQCATCRAPFPALTKLPINYALLACLGKATSSSALKKRPAEGDIFHNYCTDELLQIVEKKRRLSDLHVQIETKILEYQDLTAAVNERRENLAATVASVDKSVRDAAEELREARRPEVTAKQAAVEEAERNRRRMHTEIALLVKESGELDPNIAAGRKKAETIKSLPIDDKLSELKSAFKDRHYTQDIVVAKKLLNSTLSLLFLLVEMDKKYQSIIKGIVQVMTQHREDVAVAEKGLLVMVGLLAMVFSRDERRTYMGLIIENIDAVLQAIQDHSAKSDKVSECGCELIASTFSEHVPKGTSTLNMMAELVVQSISLHRNPLNVLATCSAIDAMTTGITPSSITPIAAELVSCGVCEKLVEALRIFRVMSAESGSSLPPPSSSSSPPSSLPSSSSSSSSSSCKRLSQTIEKLCKNGILKKIFHLCGVVEVLENCSIGIE